MIQSVSSIGAGIIIAFIYSWELSLFILGLAPFFAIGGYLEMKVMAGLTGTEALEGAGQVSLLLCLVVFSYTTADHSAKFVCSCIYNLIFCDSRILYYTLFCSLHIGLVMFACILYNVQYAYNLHLHFICSETS